VHFKAILLISLENILFGIIRWISEVLKHNLFKSLRYDRMLTSSIFFSPKQIPHEYPFLWTNYFLCPFVDLYTFKGSINRCIPLASIYYTYLW
jgi:hypothetical protein